MMRKNLVTAFGLRWSRTKERGATAVVLALTLLIFVGAAAVSFDTANLALQRQTLRNIVDAAAQAGAGYLPDITTAKNQAKAYAAKYDPSIALTLTGWCVVNSTGVTKQVASGQFPSTCDPSPSGSHVFVNGSGGVICDQFLCSIPCNAADAQCNALQVSSSKNVPYYFAPAIGIPSGDTGSVTSVSCTNLCNGGGTVNPLDVAFIADRTTSLDSTVFSNMKTGISDTLKSMTPEFQFVTVGTIHKSATSGSCKTNLKAYSTDPTGDGAARTGSWMPLDFSNNYLTGTLGTASRPLNTTSDLVSNLTCMNQATQPWGTHLAAPLKAAARKLLNLDTTNNSLAAMSATRAALLPPGVTAKKVLIMETDGVPEESIGFNGRLTSGASPYYTATDKSLGSTALTDSLDPVSGSPWNGELGCTNLKTVAANAKAAGITVIMIGYGLANTAKCNRDYNGGPYTGSNVDDVLAAAASNAPDGTASKANNDCTTTAGAAAENSDGDFYFCAATGAQLAGIFTTALKQAQGGTTKFIKMPV
jgi:Flp pilus assembly protein TadG